MPVIRYISHLKSTILRLGTLVMFLLPLLVACGDNTPTQVNSAAPTQTGGVSVTTASSQVTTTSAGGAIASGGVATTAAGGVSTAAPAGGKAGGTLTMGAIADFTQGDPHTLNSSDILIYGPPMLQTLTAFNTKLELVPYLAEKWSASTDGLSYTFNIRQGVKFHNGKDMTAQEVVWNFKRILDPNTKALLSSQLASVTDVKAPDNFTVVFTLKNKDAALPYSLALPGRGGILAPDSVGADGKYIKTIGTGPFMLESFKQGDRTTYKKFPDYWEKGYPLVDTLIIKPLSDETTRFNALQSGDVDIIAGVPIEQFGKPANPNFSLVKAETTGGV